MNKKVFLSIGILVVSFIAIKGCVWIKYDYAPDSRHPILQLYETVSSVKASNDSLSPEAAKTDGFPLEVDNRYLFPHLIEESSYLSKDDFVVKNNYHPYYVIDDNQNTAWVEGVPGDGLGEYIIMFERFPKNELFSIQIMNGYQKNEDVYFKNNRVKDLEIRLTSGTMKNPEFTSYTYTLEDKMGFQQYDIEPKNDCWAITFVVRSVYKGTKYDDTCISEIHINYKTKELVNVKSQKENRSYYSNWFEERNKKALFFSNLPKDYPFKPYKKLISRKNVEEDKWYDSEKVLFKIKFFNEVFSDSKLVGWANSNIGKDYIKMLNDEKIGKGEVVKLSFNDSKLYIPDILAENIFTGIEKYLYVSNLNISNGTSKLKKNNQYEVFRSGKNIRKMRETSFDEDGQKDCQTEYYYDNGGKLFFIKGDLSGDDGEYYNNLLLVWNKNKIVQIFWFWVEAANKGVDVQLTVYQ